MRDIYDILEEISNKNALNADDLDFLYECTENKSAEIRAYAAELLISADGDKAKTILIGLCGDSDELVRVNACDSLSAYADKEVFDTLKNCAENDKSGLVKSYALLSIADITEKLDIDKSEAASLFLKHKNSENTGVKTACFKGLYKLGKTQYLTEILKLLSSPSYQVRAAVINSLFDLADRQSCGKIAEAAKEQLSAENSEAVKIKLNELLQYINQ